MHHRHPQTHRQSKVLSSKTIRMSPICRMCRQPLEQTRIFWNHQPRRVLSTPTVLHSSPPIPRQMRMRISQDLSSLSSQCKSLVKLQVATLRIPLRPKTNSLTWSTMANSNSLHNNRSSSSKSQPWSTYQTNWPDFSLDSWIWTSSLKCRMPSEISMSHNRTRISNRLPTRCNSSSCQQNHKTCNKFPWVRPSSMRRSNTVVISIRASKASYRARHRLLIRKITPGNRPHLKLRPRRVKIHSRYSTWLPTTSTSSRTSTSARYQITISACHSRCLSTLCKWTISSRATILNNQWCKATSSWAITKCNNLCHRCSNKYNTQISTTTSTCHKTTRISNTSSLRSLTLTFMMRSTRFKNNLISPKMSESTFFWSYRRCVRRFSSLATIPLLAKAIRRPSSRTATVWTNFHLKSWFLRLLQAQMTTSQRSSSSAPSWRVLHSNPVIWTWLSQTCLCPIERKWLRAWTCLQTSLENGIWFRTWTPFRRPRSPLSRPWSTWTSFANIRSPKMPATCKNRSSAPDWIRKISDKPKTTLQSRSKSNRRLLRRRWSSCLEYLII